MTTRVPHPIEQAAAIIDAEIDRRLEEIEEESARALESRMQAQRGPTYATREPPRSCPGPGRPYPRRKNIS